VTTPVGDRYVLETLRERGLNLGGEQSGHLIDLDHATTGDGVLAALRILEVIRTSGASLAELATVMQRLPQVLINVGDVDHERAATSAAIADAVAAAAARLGADGRVLVRPSGTERLVRVMVEARDEASCERIARELVAIVERELPVTG
jgi:phosphoglucosamine mutase